MVRSDGTTIRYGTLFEILDALAGDVACRHAMISPNELTTIVTASVDGMNAFSDITVCKDLKLQGYITYVGTSSMEVCIDLVTVSKSTLSEKIAGKTHFIMVARYKNTYIVMSMLCDIWIIGKAITRNPREFIRLKLQMKRYQSTNQLLSPNKSFYTTEKNSLNYYLITVVPELRNGEEKLHTLYRQNRHYLLKLNLCIGEMKCNFALINLFCLRIIFYINDLQFISRIIGISTVPRAGASKPQSILL